MLEDASQGYIALTLLYGFSSDSDELVVNPMFTLMRYEPSIVLPLYHEDVIRKHIQLHEPDYVLLQRPFIPLQEHRQNFASLPSTSEAAMVFLFGLLSSMFYFPATNLFRLLRLFKNERLVAGDTFVISTKQSEERVLSQTSFGKRCSENDIDYTLLQLSSGSYTLNSADIPFFTVFSNALLPQLQALQEPQSVETPPPLEIALVLYNQDDYLENVAVLNCLTALEALLTNDSNTELSYRLSVRVANLLGSDDADRVSLFREMKEFYDLRSKIVHGSASKLSTKLQNRLQLTDSLREIVRKVILSVMALAISSELTQSRLEELLDQLVFDEAKRRDVQRLASKFLHIGTPLQFVQ